MVSVVLGAAAAVCWGFQNVLMARSARLVAPGTVAAQYVGYQAVLIAPVAVVQFVGAPPALDQVGLVLAGGVAQGLGVLCFATALRSGAVGVMTGLLSLMGGAAALLSIATGEALGWLVGVGLALASVGGVFLVAAPDENAPAAATRLTLIAVVLTGSSLWLLGLAEVGLGPSLLAFNAGGFVAIWLLEFSRGHRVILGERDNRPVLLVLAAALGVLGLAAFSVGAHEGSTAVTAVLAAQFASVAAIGGFVAFGERMSPRQLAGFVALIAGVSLVAAAS